MKTKIDDLMAGRILVLDGGLGTMIQGYGFSEEDFRGVRFADWKTPVKGCNDLLALTQPAAVARIHEAYLMAGADIISTDSFNANAVSLADYGLEEYAYEINRAAAALARAAADRITLGNPGRPRFVAGSIGPTNRTSSIASDVNDPAAREIDFDALAAAYRDQIRGLLDGGADLLLIETIFDTLNAKAAVFAAEEEFERRGMSVPIMISGTVNAGGRTLSGQTVEAFYASLAHARPLSVGLNCGFGARQLMPYVERLAAVCDFGVSAHPNAGLPNISGGYDETPEMMAADMEEYMRRGLVNIVGGCCGTTPAHIAAIASAAAKYPSRPIPEPRRDTVLCGLEELRLTAGSNFINVGERSNVAGSAKFARIIREGGYDQALAIAREQVEAGAGVVDVCMDDGLIDGPAAMTRFLRVGASDVEFARVPVMIDSSSWETLEAGLKCTQGKSIVNSISLKEGEREFVRRARLIRRYGAAAVVMLFDQRGQADTYERKIEVAARAYEILQRIGFPPEDIVFDANVLSVATGMPEHDRYGLDFIEAVRWIKCNLPHARTSAGVSNLSFSFRGNNKVREAMHSVFLYHAIGAGLDMGIVNPAMLQVYSEIEPELLTLAEDVVLARRPDAADRLAAYAEKVKTEQGAGQTQKEAEGWRSAPVAERLAHAMTRGVTDFVEADTLEAYRLSGSPLSVIDEMLMPAMGRVGELFGEGKMFLPQVVKSARVMRTAVDTLTPYIEKDKSASRDKVRKVVIATVKGDVHDIGKNIVSVVLSCNGYQVVDLGVMVEADVIADATQRENADAVALSGLISPSLDEMIKVVRELERRGVNVPVNIGGATTSRLHTAVKIAPDYSGVVLHSRDASECAAVLNRALGDGREQYIAEVKEEQTRLRARYEEGRDGKPLVTLVQARGNRAVKRAEDIVPAAQTGTVVFRDFPAAEVEKYIDWNYFFPAWEIRGSYPALLDSPEKGDQARRLFADARAMLERIKNEKLLSLNGIVGVFPARAEGDDIVITDASGMDFRLAQLRNQQAGQAENLSLADFVAVRETGDVAGGAATQDYVGVFALSAGTGLRELVADFRARGDDYSAIMAKLLSDRLTEALAETLHSFVRRTLWGYETGPEPAVEEILAGKYQGIRTAFGYPACPDHSLKREAFAALKVEGNIPLKLTENYMIDPGEALCGLIFAGRDTRFFSVGRIDQAQLEDYAARRGMPAEEIARLIRLHT